MISVQWITTFPKLPFLTSTRHHCPPQQRWQRNICPWYSKPDHVHLTLTYICKSRNKGHIQQHTYCVCSDDCWTLAVFYNRDDKMFHQITCFLYDIRQSIKRKNWQSVSYEIDQENCKKSTKIDVNPTKHRELNAASMLGPSWQLQI